MNRRQMAVKIGGQFLLRAILRAHLNSYRRRLPDHLAGNPVVKDLTPEQTNALRLEWTEADSHFQSDQLPRVMTAPIEELSDSEKAWIRGRFYDFVNMPMTTLSRWLHDPLVEDGVNKKLYHAGLVARQHLRNLVFMKASTRRDGHGWRPRDYDTARRSIFVVQNLLRPRIIDYPTWVLLQNFGHDWTRTFTMRPQRRLPMAVEDQIKAARRALKSRQVSPGHASLGL